MINETLNLIYNEIKSLNLKKIVPINKALNEICAKDIVAIKDLPCFDNSALDGYAFNHKNAGKTLKIKGIIYAGEKKEFHLNDNECYKIMTGAIMPKGADTVLRTEDANVKNDVLFLPNEIKKFDGYRLKGEEVTKGKILIKKGEVITPRKIMLLASQGINEVEIYKKPKIALFSSGDELKEPWQKADEYEIYNANASGIEALLKNNSFESKYLGIIKDEPLTIKESFEKCFKEFDFVITSGGASAGDKDYMDEILKDFGFKEIFDHVNIKPGRPTKCFIKDEKIVFVLAGNPTAAYLLAFLLVIPTLKKLINQNNDFFEISKTKFSGNLKLKSGRINAILGIYDDFCFKVIDDNKFGSGTISPLAKATHLYLSDLDKKELKDGEIIEILKLD
ncbi:molybdopterin molybdotransferase MoeA [Campylobacter ureolyticus]|uniref:Molybdopterin molybdenumtransferase n=1 Tax=Campylobacter ureolyticus TaxID=827 RepID=A0A9Q4KLL2_9BACT|nr:molybdopterin molybdotransferase MoeA [Campylobacter ureolyticus]MCZ6103895.1 molybdopterin molybdotransferase MoeA [Campylobacter ureolyticus]MCZ6134652.1 molybdopterin molybdotransferase MoeA [Campylobacter ureolyticus]MCZ6161868.1 molybdopterin molybdotransferase MoeA [Campylobacter ureolyticus]MCZ6171056.1 molybdopterin molybdotransferase MoeA [Campylobacter ureolyticus]MDU4981743.1 molybdopterin molybdotransferase MoeA [Campylobacter ureolyticus]